MVIVPKIVMGKWIKEINEWIPTLRVVCFYGNAEEREVIKARMRGH